MIPSNKTLKRVLARRAAEKEELPSFVLEDHLFKQQLAFIADPAAFKVAVCSRRSGKSTGIAYDLVDTATKFKDCTVLYITGTRSDAKKIIWQEILKVNRTHNFGGIANISELTLTFPKHNTIIRLAGAKDEQEIEKIRGQLPPIKKVFIDEAQSIRDRVMVKLIDDVLEAALLDYAASLCLTGTPGAIPIGYFYRVAHNLDKNYHPLKEKVWSNHSWTFFDNPYIPVKSKTSHTALLNRVLSRRGVGLDDPSIQREFFGKWTQDVDSLLLHYNVEKNHFIDPPKGMGWNYIMGIDLGFDDADAIAVLAWSEGSQDTYLVEELVVPQQGITELVGQIEALQKKYPISKMVIDQGGLGKKIAEELRRRHQIPVEAAEKARKMENVAFLNDAMRTKKFFAKKDSKFAQDTYLVEIDRDKSTSDKIKVSDKYHSDIIDAVLYAFKLSPAYAYEAPKNKPLPGTPEWYTLESDEMFEREREGLMQQLEESQPYRKYNE
jgi:hypothetical protein